MRSYPEKLLLYLLLGFLCSCQSARKEANQPASQSGQFTQYSTAVNDSFYIQTQLPLAYDDSIRKRYPVVVVLNANFHFPMLAASIRQYEKGGLLPPVILVGIGYKTFKDMDSLRVRDYLYPAALPSDEMTAPGGGGEKFSQFITDELLPKVDSMFRTTTHDRSLLGHSFGGYFALYHLLNQSASKKNNFKNFVAASPSLWYHDYYINQLPASLKTVSKRDSIQLLLSVGELENPVWDIRPNQELAAILKETGTIKVEGGTFSHLDHMDTGQLSFLKGLQRFYR